MTPIRVKAEKLLLSGFCYAQFYGHIVAVEFKVSAITSYSI